jgi:hypothetical protein
MGVDSSGDVFLLQPVRGTEEDVPEIELSSSGQLDASVTAEPIVASSTPFYTNQPRLFEPNGESIVAFTVGTAKKSYKAEVEKLTSAGTPESTFQSSPFRFNGETTTLGTDYPAAAAFEPNGKLVVVGSHVGGTSPRVGEAGIARLDETARWTPRLPMKARAPKRLKAAATTRSPSNLTGTSSRSASVG